MKPHETYCSQMCEAKIRLISAERMVESQSPLTGYSSLDSEFCFLQIRKINELITFSGMVREEARYRKLRDKDRRSDKDRVDPSADWKASKILARLVKLSPHMLPIPLGEHFQSELRTIHFERKDLAVNHERLIELYETCSEFMHVSNPLVENIGEQVEDQRQKYTNAPDTVRAALTFLRRLLWLHAVVKLEWTDTDNPCSIENPECAWIVDFSAPDDQTVNMTLATTLDTDPA
ncbi:MAG: hypothetical protein V4693_16740 [Pseudomonadota bacterium]